MASKVDSARFAEVFRTLPQDAQQTLVETHLIPLLGRVPRRRAKRANAAAARLHRRHQDMPVLDLKAKRREISFLLEELTKDSKRSFVMDITSKPEILNEIINSLADWLNDIWTVAFEHRMQYEVVHECLLFVDSTLNRLANVRMCCKCCLTNMYIPVVIKSKSGAVVKRFSIDGAHKLDAVLQFIWRDMFLCMLASGKKRHVDQVSEMLDDIHTTIGWNALVRIMHGGREQRDGHENDDDVDDSDWDDTDEDEDSGCESVWDGDGIPRCRHWTPRIQARVAQLLGLIEDAMKRGFEILPSAQLYHALVDNAMDPFAVSGELLAMLDKIADTCSDTFAVALKIYAYEFKVEPVVKLLQTHSHLLRPRDAQALQVAVSLLAHSDHTELALSILRKELLDTALAVRQALLLSYSRMDEPANRAEFLQVIKLRAGSAGRRNRMEVWVDSISSPGADAPNAIMFAAMMMGVPPMPGMNSDDDPYTYLDLDPHDPDLEDLRQQFRPPLKGRFESWVDVALAMKGGPATLLNVYQSLIGTMPFLRAGDVTEEMIGRLQDRPSKQFVCDGLDALLAFVKIQRRKLSIAKAEGQKRKETETQSPKVPGSSTSTTPSVSGATSASTSTATSTPVSTSPSSQSTLPTGLTSPSASSVNHANATAGPSTAPATSGPMHNILRNQGMSATPTSHGTPPVPLPLSFLFGAGLANPPPAPGPSLDDVD